jgi:hypothetical protein
MSASIIMKIGSEMYCVTKQKKERRKKKKKGRTAAGVAER